MDRVENLLDEILDEENASSFRKYLSVNDSMNLKVLVIFDYDGILETLLNKFFEGLFGDKHKLNFKSVNKDSLSLITKHKSYEYGKILNSNLVYVVFKMTREKYPKIEATYVKTKLDLVKDYSKCLNNIPCKEVSAHFSKEKKELTDDKPISLPSVIDKKLKIFIGKLYLSYDELEFIKESSYTNLILWSSIYKIWFDLYGQNLMHGPELRKILHNLKICTERFTPRINGIQIEGVCLVSKEEIEDIYFDL